MEQWDSETLSAIRTAPFTMRTIFTQVLHYFYAKQRYFFSHSNCMERFRERERDASHHKSFPILLYFRLG